jgi:hypothetical protein
MLPYLPARFTYVEYLILFLVPARCHLDATGADRLRVSLVQVVLFWFGQIADCDAPLMRGVGASAHS